MSIELVVIPDVRNMVVAHFASKNDVVIVLFCMQSSTTLFVKATPMDYLVIFFAICIFYIDDYLQSKDGHFLGYF